MFKSAYSALRLCFGFKAPCANDITKVDYAIWKNFHFSGFNVNPAPYNSVNNCRKWPMYSSGLCKNMTISSKLTRENWQLSLVNWMYIARWDVSGALLLPTGMEVKRKSHYETQRRGSPYPTREILLGSNGYQRPISKTLSHLQASRCTRTCTVSDTDPRSPMHLTCNFPSKARSSVSSRDQDKGWGLFSPA